jgi:hypothetical protein
MIRVTVTDAHITHFLLFRLISCFRASTIERVIAQGVAELVEAADAAVDGLLAIDPAALDQEDLRALTLAAHRLQSRMDAVATKATGAFDRLGDPQGAIGTAAFVAWKCRLRKEAVKAELSRARALRSMPAVALAYEAGAVSSDHVRLLAVAQRSAPDAFDAKEQQLVADAMDLRFDTFVRRIRIFQLEHDASGSDDRAAEAMDRRRCCASKTFEGTVEETSTFDPIGGDIWLRELQRLEKQLFEQDWAEARARLGDAARAEDLRRTPTQRRADAHVLMAIRSATLGKRAAARPLFTVHVGYETFTGAISQLADGTVVTPTAIVPWLIEALGSDVDLGAEVERIVFGGPSRVLDVGVRQRCFVGATRRAVEARDLECWHESCDVPYERCDVDHIVRFEHGGETVQENGRIACPHHNPGRRAPYRPPPPDDS